MWVISDRPCVELTGWHLINDRVSSAARCGARGPIDMRMGHLIYRPRLSYLDLMGVV